MLLGEKLSRLRKSKGISQENLAEKSNISHIALATLINADILVSWNFKHIVNITRIRGYNAVNIKNGHRVLEIRTPREILEL